MSPLGLAQSVELSDHSLDGTYNPSSSSANDEELTDLLEDKKETWVVSVLEPLLHIIVTCAEDAGVILRHKYVYHLDLYTFMC